MVAFPKIYYFVYHSPSLSICFCHQSGQSLMKPFFHHKYGIFNSVSSYFFNYIWLISSTTYGLFLQLLLDYFFNNIRLVHTINFFNYIWDIASITFGLFLQLHLSRWHVIVVRLLSFILSQQILSPYRCIGQIVPASVPTDQPFHTLDQTGRVLSDWHQCQRTLEHVEDIEVQVGTRQDIVFTVDESKCL